jgi:hypothetical protein
MCWTAQLLEIYQKRDGKNGKTKNMTKNKLFLINVNVNKKQIETHCYGDNCGKGCIGCVIFHDVEWLPCREMECPISDAVLNIGETELFGKNEFIVVRKLKVK